MVGFKNTEPSALVYPRTHTAENTHAQINNKSHSSKREEEELSEAFIVHMDGKYKMWTQAATITFILFAVAETGLLMSQGHGLLFVEHKTLSGSALFSSSASPSSFVLCTSAQKHTLIRSSLRPLQPRVPLLL